MGLSVCLCEFVCSMFVQEPAEAKGGVSSSGTELQAVVSHYVCAGDCNLVLLQEQEVLLTAAIFCQFFLPLF